MNTRLQVKTLVRLMVVIVVGSVGSTFLAGPPADAAVDGYGVTNAVSSEFAAWHNPTLIEGRSTAVVSSGE